MGKRKQRDDDEYQVEYIIEAQLEGKGSKNWQYLVKWWSFPDSENSKVPESNLAGCERLLKSFWGQFPEHKKWEFPKKAKSSKEWIEKEKKYFASSVKKQKPPAMKKSKTDASQTAGGSTDRRASVASTSTTSTSTNTTTPTARRSKRNMKSQEEVSQADSARTSRSSTLSSVPPSPKASKPPEPAPAPPASSAPMPPSSSSPATVKKRRTPRDKYKVNTTDEEDDDEEEDSSDEESDEDDKPINKLKGKGKAPAARLPDRAKPTAPVRRNTTLASSQPSAFLKARAASFSTGTSSTSKSLAKTTAPSTSVKSSTPSTSKSTTTAKPTDAPPSKTTAKLPIKSAASKSTTVPTPTPQPTMATPADSEPMEIDDDESEKNSLFDGDDGADEPETSTSTMPPPDSPLTPMSALSGAATVIKAADPRAQAVASAAATAAKIAAATATATKTVDPRSKPSAAAASPASAGPSKPPRPVGATSTIGPGLKKLTGETPAVPKVPAHRQKRGLQPLPFDQLVEFNAAVNPTKARIIDRVNAGSQRPELSINTSASPQEAAAVSPSPALSGSRNGSLEPSSVKPGTSTAKPPAAKVPEASSSKPVASSPITALPPEMQQLIPESTAPSPQEPASKPAKASPAPAATATATRWLQDDDMVMSPVAMSDNGLSGLDAADHRGSTPAKSKSPAVPTPPPAAVHGSSRLRQSVNAPPSGTSVALYSSVPAASSRLSPPAGSASNVTVTASAVSLPAVQPAAQPTLQPTAPPVAGPFIPALKQPAKLPSNSPPAQVVPTTNTSATTTTTTSAFSSAGYGHEGLQWLNAWSADSGILPAPAQQQQPQTTGALGRIPKKWHWEGDLVLGDSQASLCRLRLHEPWPSQGAEPLFKVLFNSERTTFNLPKTYPLSQAWAFFPLFEAKQWVKVVLPESGADVVAYTSFAGYLESNQLFAMARVPSHSPNATHHIVVFHNMLKPLAHILQCPEFLQTSPQLVAAIVVPAEPQGPLGDPMRAFSWNEMTRYAERQTAQLAQKISSQEVQPADLATPHRLGVKLPDALAAQLKGKDFIIYTADLARYHDKRGMVLALGQETTDLLRSCSLAGGTFRTMYERVPFIFIHRDNWRMLHVEHKNLPGLRSKRAEENYSRQFWLYGTSPLCPPRYQGLELKQIFLYGGVVTFTARAVAEDPKGVEALIKRIDKHPLWVCYVLPEVVALVREMTCEPAYEKTKLADGVSAVSALLGPIEKRRISLMSHPPPSWDGEACRNWIMDVTDVSEKKPLEVLDYCIEKLAAHGRPEANKENFVNELVFEDLRQMEGHHIVGTTYRRFVAIVEDLPDTIPPHEGWERKNLRHFKFGDNLDDMLLNGDQSTPGPSATPVTVV